MTQLSKPSGAKTTREAISRANPENAECMFQSTDIERQIMRLVDPGKKSGARNVKMEQIRLWLWCLYRRGRLDYMREAMYDETPSQRGAKNAQDDATGFYS